VQNVINKPVESHNTRLNAELSLAIIVPLLNEVQRLPSLIKELDQSKAEKIIIVDGGSTDGSVEYLLKHLNTASDKGQETLFLESTPGRAVQMNLGAEHSEQDILLFLHADTVLPETVSADLSCVDGNQLDELSWGRFNVAFDESCAVMGVIAFFINWRSRLSGVATGDQAIFVKNSLFKRVGGYDNIELMEDVALSKKLRKFSRPTALKSSVITSARRWKQNGILRTVVKMWWYRFAYFIGVSPASLVNGYRNVR